MKEVAKGLSEFNSESAWELLEPGVSKGLNGVGCWAVVWLT